MFRNDIRQLLPLFLLATLACEAPIAIDYSGPVAQWADYGADKGGMRYSPLNQINRDNVQALKPAWVYHHGDFSHANEKQSRTSFNATPIVANGSLYFCTAYNRVVALNPETGKERWTFDPKLRNRKLEGPYPLTCRGVAYWDGRNQGDQDAPCRERIFSGTLDSELIAIDAQSGKACKGFGKGGRVSLRDGVGEAPAWEYYVTSPPQVIGDRVVVGALISDNLRSDAPAGVVRAFDARSGKLLWAWDPIPPGYVRKTKGHAGYTLATPNVWSILSADPERNLVFVPTGNAAPDYFAANRNGLDYYASSVVALDADQGVVRWFFQTVHHDVWDYDVASQPVLFPFQKNNEQVPALAQATKMGHIFLLDRDTGDPLFPVEERPVPQGGVPGEQLSPTQPFPTHPKPIHPATLTPDDAWGFTFWDRKGCAEIIAGYRSEGIFTPPSLGGSIQYPGSAGGANWGSVAIDPHQQVLYVNQLRMPSVVKLIPRGDYLGLDDSAAAYPNELYPMSGTPYGLMRTPLLSPWGAPCNPPPWGTLTAVDLQSGKVLWESVLGTTRDQAPFPLWFRLGAPNLGGSIVTAGGLLFIGATTDRFFRAFDVQSGEELWSTRIPYTANATPLTYRLHENSKQYVVVASGGHGWSEPGDALIAYALRSSAD